MVEFKTLPSYHPLDKADEFMSQEEPKLEEPIVPISQIGSTVPEHDPVFKNMVQTVQANIRRGVGTMQLVMQTPPESAIGGRAKAYGKEIREAIREVVKANEVKLKGIEMPTQMNNLSGFDGQQRIFSEEKRLQHVQEVKDTLKFAADIGSGGGVDIVSFEFPRPVNEATWQPRKSTGVVDDSKMKFKNEGETSVTGVVDKRTGQIMMTRIGETQFLFRDKEKGHRKIDQLYNDQGKPIDPVEWKWEDFQQWAKDESSKEVDDFKQRFGRLPTPEELYFHSQIDQQIEQYSGQVAYYNQYVEQEEEKIKRINEMMEKEKKANNERTVEQLKHRLDLAKQQRDHFIDSVKSAKQHIAEFNHRKSEMVSMHEYGVEQTTQSYADLGIAAMKETKSNPRAKTDLYVGPEIGWPGQYGGHPDEFREIVNKSRQKMAERLVKEHQEISRKEAEVLAKRHIKGMFDTSHMGMWWEHWDKSDTNKSEAQHFKDFEKWYNGEIDKMIKDDVIGSIQVVDSQTAAHGHLPPGQGIFGDVIKETVKKLKRAGFSGMIVSEGHEEEKFGEGRILYKTWEHLGGYTGKPLYSAQFPGRSWSQMQHSYMGRTYSPLYMFGSYAPSNEFKLWSEVPFE